MTDVRIDRHRKLSAFLSSQNDVELARLVDTVQISSVGVGGAAGVIRVYDNRLNGVPVFTKRIPLSVREIAEVGSTSNHFDLPTFCQYGIGGPSFNAWRELATNLVVTDAVLAGETQSFPMLYHWRILPGRSPVAAEHADIDSVHTAGASREVRTRLEALAAAPCSLVLFCEYIEHPISNWLEDNPSAKAAEVERQFSEIVAFLRDRQLLHMDGHFGNMRTDMERIYLTDFGLATSPHFDLSTAEHDFVRRHATHDADYAAMLLVNWLVTEVCGVPRPTSGGPVARNQYVRRCATGHIPGDVTPEVAAIVTRHAPAAARMNDFYWRLFDGDFDPPYPQAAPVPPSGRAQGFP